MYDYRSQTVSALHNTSRKLLRREGMVTKTRAYVSYLLSLFERCDASREIVQEFLRGGHTALHNRLHDAIRTVLIRFAHNTIQYEACSIRLNMFIPLDKEADTTATLIPINRAYLSK